MHVARAAGHERQTTLAPGRRAATGLASQLGASVHVISGVDDLYGAKTGVRKPLAIVFDQDCASYAADIGHQIIADFWRQRFLQGNVANGQPSTRLQNAGNLTEHGWFVRREVDNAITDDA